MEFINLIKHNYKVNIKGYIIIWILLLAPIAFCTTKAIQLSENEKYRIEEAKSTDYDDFIEYELPDGMVLEEYLPVSVVYNSFIPTFLFAILSVVIVTFVFILSKRNRKDFRNTQLYVALSLLFYFAILCGIMKWFDNVTVLVKGGSAISHRGFTSLLLPCILIVVSLGIYLGLCCMFYRIISWLSKKRRLFMILSILIILPIWILISYCYLLFLIMLVLQLL